MTKDARAALPLRLQPQRQPTVQQQANTSHMFGRCIFRFTQSSALVCASRRAAVVMLCSLAAAAARPQPADGRPSAACRAYRRCACVWHRSKQTSNNNTNSNPLSHGRSRHGRHAGARRSIARSQCRSVEREQWLSAVCASSCTCCPTGVHRHGDMPLLIYSCSASASASATAPASASVSVSRLCTPLSAVCPAVSVLLSPPCLCLRLMVFYPPPSPIRLVRLFSRCLLGLSVRFDSLDSSQLRTGSEQGHPCLPYQRRGGSECGTAVFALPPPHCSSSNGCQ